MNASKREAAKKRKDEPSEARLERRERFLCAPYIANRAALCIRKKCTQREWKLANTLNGDPITGIASEVALDSGERFSTL